MQLLSKEAQNVPESEKIRIVVSLLFYLRFHISSSSRKSAISDHLKLHSCISEDLG